MIGHCFLILNGTMQYVPVASFASSILSSKDHPSLVIGALQLVDLLLTKLPSLYKPTFHREGVFHEIETLAERTLLSSTKIKEKDGSETNDDASISNPPTLPGFKKLSSLSLDPEDAITLRARVIQFKHLSDKDDVDEDSAFQSLRAVVDRLSAKNASDQAYSQALWELADLFASPHTSVSSFELLKSGVVDSLLQFATDEDRSGIIKFFPCYLSPYSLGLYSEHPKAQRNSSGRTYWPKDKAREYQSDAFRNIGEEITRKLYTDGVFRSDYCRAEQRW